MSAALTAEQARGRLPNLLVVEQTLLVTPEPSLAAVPDFVLARALGELRSLATFWRSQSLQSFYLAAYAQALHNEEVTGSKLAAVESWDDPKDRWHRSENGDDFQDTEPQGEPAAWVGSLR